MDFTSLIDAYGWWIAGLLLLIGEILIPGIFLIWLGLAALIMGVIDALFPALPWYWQLAVYAVIAGAMVFGVRPILSRELDRETERPTLNRRLHAMVGRTGMLSEPIAGGVGRARIGDTQWRVRGPDLPEGTRVRVVGVDEETLALLVEPDLKPAFQDGASSAAS